MTSSDKLRQASSPKNVLLLLGCIWVGFAFYIGMVQVSGILTIRDFEPDFVNGLILLTTNVWLPWLFLSPIVVLFARRFPVQPGKLVQPVLILTLVLVVLSVLMGLVLGILYHYSGNMSPNMQGYEPWQHAGHYLFGDRLFLYNAIIYTVLIAAFNIHNYYSVALQRERDSARLSTQLKEAQLHALKMQINPHFLFNTLNSISVLILKKENDKAQQMIQGLGSFFRSNLQESGEQWVPLTKELETLEKYLAIEKIRFADRLQIKQLYDHQTAGIKIPAMLLQPLVENAIAHGVGNVDRPCELCIETQVRGSTLHISIRDNGAGCQFYDDPQFVEGVGISNVRERLHQNYGDKYIFELKGALNEGSSITIEVPTHAPNDTSLC